MNKIKTIMEISPNRDKSLVIQVNGQEWKRYPVKTHFIGLEDKIDDIVAKYIIPIAQKGDIVALGQKIISIIQNRIIYKKDLRVGFWAKFLSKFAKKTPYGFSVGNPLKMQVAINMAGLPRIIFAGICSMVAKLFGISGTFYRIAGHKINEIDGFYGKFYPQYQDMGILGPVDCDKLCENLKDKFGFCFFIADVNDLGGNVLGKTKDLNDNLLLELLKDNPAGQADEQTPIIIIRKT